MNTTLSDRLPKDFSSISMIPNFNKPKSAFYSQKKTLAPMDTSQTRGRSKGKSRHKAISSDVKVQINNKSNLWCEVRISGKLLPQRSYHSIAFSNSL